MKPFASMTVFACLLTAGLFLGAAQPTALAKGGGTTNTIVMTGPSQITAPALATFSFSAAPFQSDWFMAWSLSNAGSTIKGHCFDLGPGLEVFAQGNTGFIGIGSADLFVPAKASGRTFYTEVAAISGGQIFDSNICQVDVL